MNFSKAQISMEATLVFIFVLLVITSMIVVLPLNFSEISIFNEKNIAKKTLLDIKEAADQVYLIGNDTILYIWVEIPQNLNYSLSYIGAPSGVSDWNLRKQLRFSLIGGGDLIEQTLGPICGEIPRKSGKSKIRVEYNQTDTPHVMINSNC